MSNNFAQDCCHLLFDYHRL